MFLFLLEIFKYYYFFGARQTDELLLRLRNARDEFLLLVLSLLLFMCIFIRCYLRINSVFKLTGFLTVPVMLAK